MKEIEKIMDEQIKKLKMIKLSLNTDQELKNYKPSEN
jgi:hypothetical protein